MVIVRPKLCQKTFSHFGNQVKVEMEAMLKVLDVENKNDDYFLCCITICLLT